MADWLVFERGTPITQPTPLVLSDEGFLIARAIPVTDFVIFELPWFYDQNPDTSAGSLSLSPKYGVVAVRPDQAQISADVYINDGVADRLFLNPVKLDYQPDKIWVTEAVTESSTQIKLSSAPLGRILLISNPSVAADEFIYITPTSTANTFDMARGMFDTLPHPIEVDTLVWDMTYLWRSREMHRLRTARIRLVSRTADGVQEYDNGVEDTARSSSRINKPLVPARIRINGSLYPTTVSGAITVDYAFRARDSQLADNNHDWLTFAGDSPQDAFHSVVVRIEADNIGDNPPPNVEVPAAANGSLSIPVGDIIAYVGSNSARVTLRCWTNYEEFIFDGSVGFDIRRTSVEEFSWAFDWSGEYDNVLQFALNSAPLSRPQQILRFMDLTPAAPVAPVYPMHALNFQLLRVPIAFSPDPFGPFDPNDPPQPGQPVTPPPADSGWGHDWGNNWGG